MKDPKNADKTVDELKAIVLKNMVKDVNYYHTETSFGVKGIGYTKDVVGGGDAVAPKGKYKSSGYGDMPKAKVVKEGKDEDKIARYEKYTYTLDGEKVTPDDIAFYNNILGAELDGEVYKMGIPDENGNVELNTSKGKTGMYTESKHGDEADLKIYKSELNLINKTKASGEKQLKRKADLEKKIADLEKKQNESLNESTKSMDFSAKDQKDWSEQKSKMYDVWANKSNELVDLKDDLKKAKNRNDKDEVKRINNKILQKQIAIKTAKEKFQKLSESLNEAKKSNVHSRIKDLEKQNEVLALESKITALEEAINELTQKVSLSESDDLAEMMDPKKINELKKDIKVLEKYKMTCEKKLSKLGGKKEIVDNEEINENESENENPPNKYTFVDKKVVRRIGPQNGDKSYDIQFDDRTEKTIYTSHDDWDKINSIYQKAKNG
jgi:chromosome segregation ATPase